MDGKSISAELGRAVASDSRELDRICEQVAAALIKEGVESPFEVDQRISRPVPLSFVRTGTGGCDSSIARPSPPRLRGQITPFRAEAPLVDGACSGLRHSAEHRLDASAVVVVAARSRAVLSGQRN
jgi:hypothetical protein